MYYSVCRQIEGKVVEIAKLQEIFTEKVLEQVSTSFLSVRSPILAATRCWSSLSILHDVLYINEITVAARCFAELRILSQVKTGVKFVYLMAKPSMFLFLFKCSCN